MNKTLQDRLVKELRLEGIDTLEAGNAYLPAFMERFNAKFAQAPANATDLHRPLTERDDLEEILSWQEERTVSNSLTLQYDRVVYLLEPTELAKGLGSARDTCNFLSQAGSSAVTLAPAVPYCGCSVTTTRSSARGPVAAARRIAKASTAARSRDGQQTGSDSQG